MLLEKINISFRLYNIQTVKLVWPRAKNRRRKGPSKNFGMLQIWKTKERKTSKFVYSRGYNRNGSEGNWQLGMGRQKGVEKKLKFTLGTDRCKNMKTLYINK